jgi:uncharacterized protein YlxP (DUF503 family)
MARISLLLAEAHSLKEKRMVTRRIKDRVRERLGVFVNEVGSSEIKDSWQRAELGVAVASSDRAKALSLIDQVIRVAMSAGGAEITAIAKDAITFDAEPAPFAFDDEPAPLAAIDEGHASSGEGLGRRAGIPPAINERTGSGDKATAGDDWVPAAWREEIES